MFKISNFLQNAVKVLVLANGTVVRNLYDLRLALKYMDDKTFSIHVNRNKNDFVNWIEVAIGDVNLANSLRSATTKKEMYEIVDRRIEFLSSSLTTRSESEDKKIQSQNDKYIDYESLEDDVKKEILKIEEGLGLERFRKGLIEFLFGLVLGILFGFLLAML
ncbi:MAG: hypothetical protein QXW00_02850 [Candidatus Woesearchaeota archaeon]